MQHVNSKKAEIAIKILSSILQEERENQHKSQRLLALECGIQKSMLSRLENGVNEPKLASLMSVCEALDIKLSNIIKKMEDRLPDNFTLLEK